MKPTYALWAVIFVLSFLTAGFVPAVLLTALAAGASVATGMNVQNRLNSAPTRKELR